VTDEIGWGKGGRLQRGKAAEAAKAAPDVVQCGLKMSKVRV